MAKTAWGIELGTSSVKAVRISGDRGNAMLEEVEIVSLRDFGMGGGSSHDIATTAALADLRSRKGIRRGDQVFVSISGQNTLGRIISLPPVSDDRIRETILNEARSQIPIKLEEAVWDYQVIEDADPDERKVNLYAAKKEAVERIIGVCESAGLQVTGIQVAPLGIYNYIKYELDDAISDCCVAIDIGADNTDVILIDGQKTYVRVVPVAGNDITKALRAKFKLAAEQAEKLKRNAAKSKDAAAVFEAMKPPLKEMVGEIYRAVGFYKSQNEEANINQLVMMGNGSKLLNIKKFFEQQLQYQVHKVDAPQRLGLARSVDPSEVQANIQSLTVAIGLSLQGLGLDGLNRINLIPPEYIAAKETEKLRMPFFIGGGLAAAGGLAALVLSILSTGSVPALLQTTEQTDKEAQARMMAYNTAIDVEADRAKAISLINLVDAHVATLPAREATDNAEGRPARPLTVPVNLVTAIISSSAHDAFVRYQAAKTGQPDLPVIYHGNWRGSGGSSGNVLPSTAASMSHTHTPGWEREADQAEGGVYAPTREVRYQAYLAAELTPGQSPSDAWEKLRRVLSPSETADTEQTLREGTLRQEVRRRLMEYFEASGQLRGVTEAEKDGIRFEGVSIDVVPVQLPGAAAQTGETLPNLLLTEGTWLLPNGRSMFTNKAAPAMLFGVNNVTIIFTLQPARVAAEQADQ